MLKIVVNLILLPTVYNNAFKRALWDLLSFDNFYALYIKQKGFHGKPVIFDAILIALNVCIRCMRTNIKRKPLA